MSKKPLIIVESPAKTKTLKKFLGSDYQIESSVGHIRDLPAKDFGIDLENDFEPIYKMLPDKKEVIEKLQKCAKNASIVYLSPDPDREGEAIAWHIRHILPEGVPSKRISFNAITKDEVVKALKAPREIDEALVNAQQARRLLDRIVGYKISPILNRRLQRGRGQSVSAGRVQSVALKLVVDREIEIEAFIPTEYWNIGALHEAKAGSKPFTSSLYAVDGIRVSKTAEEGKELFLIPNQEVAEKVTARLKKSHLTVSTIERKEKKRNPQPPFITSTLQQESSRHFGYSSQKTMSIAQQLYEGLDLGKEGTEGLITYMRTDSVRIEPQSIQEARGYIQSTYGKEFLPSEPRIYTTKKNSQDAHEAIRPTNLHHHPEAVKSFLTREQYNLYSLVWKRFIASQMMPALYDTVVADIAASEGLTLRATGSQLKFQGYLAAYCEKEDDEESVEGALLPNLEEGQKLTLLEVTSEQAFTRPPPRFSEASLVKELEKLGIGRPSTYAAIMNKIQSRDYTVKHEGRLKPTELGRIIAKMLEDYFKMIMDVSFTANMEDALELVASNQKNWRELLGDFWKDFNPTIETATKEATVPRLLTEHICPSCGGKLQKIWSKTKYFLGCSNYPDCSYTTPLEAVEFSKEGYAEDFDWDQPCPKCSSEMKIRHGKFGTFLGCSRYPDCKGIVQIPKKGEKILPPEEMPNCPAIGCEGKLTARKSRFGKTFYSCSTYPECDVIVNDLSQLEEKYQDHPRTPYVKKSSKKTAAKKAPPKKAPAKKTKTEQPSVTLSKELADLLGEKELPRSEVLKKVWEYIKKEKLQEKKTIHPDAKLAKIFGSKEAISMTKLMGLLSPHLTKK